MLAVDIGTTGVRAGVFDQEGRVIAEAKLDLSPSVPATGWAEANPADWWRAACTLVSLLGRQTPLDALDAIAVTGQAPTAVLVDAEGEVIRDAILWLDVRANREALAIDSALGPGGAEAIGGNRMHAYFLGPKLAWLLAHDPSAFDRATWVLQSHSFIVMRLTGAATCDPSTAMLSAPLFDARSRDWSELGAKAVGIPTRILPRLAAAHSVVGAVTHAAALQTGLREGTPVVAGGGDFAASALGAAVIDEGDACLMLGTSGNMLMPMGEPRFDSRLINSHHVGKDCWLALGGTLCGAALEWFRGACAPGASWETLESEAASVAPEALGALTALPFFQGERTPIWDESARGVFFGIERGHMRGHLYRALLEGVALGFRHCQLVAEEHRTKFGEVAVANGAGKSALLRQILADALGVPITWRSDARGGGATLAGAAILAGIGAGVLAGPEAARSFLARHGAPGIRHEPDARAHARLCEVFARREALYAAVRPLTRSDGCLSV